MNRRRFFEFAAASACLAGCRAWNTSSSIRILSYNLHHGEGMDKKLNLERIAHVICSLQPDLVALQEVDQKTRRSQGIDQAAEYGRLTGMHVQFGKAIDFEGGAYGQAFLSRSPIHDFKVTRLPNPLKVEERVALSMRFPLRSGSFVRVVGVHLDASKSDANRWDQAGALIEHFTSAPEPVLLLGDFNATPESRVMKRLLSFWTDTAAANPQPTIPAPKPVERIDYILVRPPARWGVRSSQVHHDAVASDHRPLWADLIARS